jgi:hypothetical protein
METEKQIKMLQIAYAGALADGVLQLSKQGVLDQVTARKCREQALSGKLRAAQFGITKPEDTFLKLAEVFGCANWTIFQNNGGFTAQATGCLLCAIAKKLGAPSPCRLYCLDPMEGIIKGLDNQAEFVVQGTLFDGPKCVIQVNPSHPVC